MSDETRVQAPAPGAGLREAVEALADEWANRANPEGAESVQDWTYRMHVLSLGSILRAVLAAHPAPTDDAPRDGEAAERRTEGLSVVERAAMILGRDGNPPQLGAAMALADAGLLADREAEHRLVCEQCHATKAAIRAARGAYDETLDDLTRTLARAEKAEAEVERLRESVKVDREVIHSLGGDADRWRRIHMFTAKGASRVQADLTAVRDRARDAAAALEAENARLSGQVERVEELAADWAENYCTSTQNEGFEVALNIIRTALSDTTGEAAR